MPESACELCLLLLLGLGLGSQEALPPPCESQIYCHGELLHQVQMAKLYQDDKQFVDMPLSSTPDQVLQHFHTLASAHNHSVPRPQLQAFLQEHFQAAGQELQPWVPEDWKDSPRFLEKIADSKLRLWARQLHQLWKKLGKKVRPEVLSQPERFSLIYSQHPFIVPGGRFREFYYWDSYWVMEGLLLSEMAGTVRGMLQNFLDLVQTYGHVPNGARVYYLQRSQPPLLTLMMARYVAHTKDTAFLRDNIGTLALELDFWAEKRNVSVSLGGQSYVLNRYHVPYGGPRPESYSKDAELAAVVPEAAREALWAELKAGAESGWDFSSRWLIGSPDPYSLSSIRTSKLVPVDLNAFLCQAEGLMSSFHASLGNQAEATKYRNLRARRRAALEAVLWDQEQGAWFDFDLEHGKKNHEFYPTNLAPLWAGCFSDPAMADRALKYLEVRSQQGALASGRHALLGLSCGSHCGHQGAAVSPGGKAQERNLGFRGALPPGSPPAPPSVTVPSGTFQDTQILTYQHGVPTSLQKTGQQWDYPNAWAPLQDLVIRGLARSPSPRTQEVAFQLAQNWIQTNFRVYSQTSAMYEKYDISSGGQPGGGGEYEVQEGFGWTNGVVLMLLDHYGNRLSSAAQTAFLEPLCLAAALLLSLLLR